VAVDPLEGTRLTALGKPNAIAVIALAERGTMLFPGAAVYMEKIAVGPRALDAIDITDSPTENVSRVAEALGKTPREVDVVVLERDRHDDLIAELREAGARVRLIREGDDVFVAATGVTTGALLRGVHYVEDGAETDSIVMRSRSGTVRRVSAHHALEKLSALTGLEYR